MSSNRISERALPSPLFRKYFLAFFAAVVAPLIIHGASEAWFGIRDQRTLLDARLRAESSAAAAKIQAFLDGIRDQLAWAVQVPWTADNLDAHRLDALRVLRQVPAIVGIELLDGNGIERLRISRIDQDVIDSGLDRSQDTAFQGARDLKVWYGPITLNRGSEPYIAMSVAGNRSSAGVAVAWINLKHIWDVVLDIRVGMDGKAFVVDRDGRLVAHPSIELVLKGADGSTSAHLAALQGALAGNAGRAVTTPDLAGRSVLAAMAPVPGVDWMVVAEQPVAEAFSPIRDALWRTGLLVLAGAVFALALAYLLARRMATPIRQLEEGVARIGQGTFDHRIELNSGDELERLANRVNEMAGELALSQERSDRIARLKQFLSPQVAEIVESTSADRLLEGRRALVAVVFCDLRGFTDFSAKAEPEEIMHVLAEYYAAIGSCIARHEATLTHFSGDGVMVLVNAPLPCNDDPALRAVRMAIDMRSAVQSLIPGWHGRNHTIGFGVGLALGEATVGRVGYEGRHDYTAIGSVVNLASRLCGAAEDGQILLDSVVATAVSASVAVAALGDRAFKGFAAAVPVHMVAGAAAPTASAETG